MRRRKTKEDLAKEEFEKARELLENEEFEKASRNFLRIKNQFSKLGASDNANLAEGYKFLADAEALAKDNRDLLGSMKAFGRAIVIFSKKFPEEAKRARIGQARAQSELAKQKALAGDFLAAARFYESSAAVYQAGEMKELAAKARARANVERAAHTESDFEKAEFLEAAIQEFRIAGEDSLLIEAHAEYYKGKTLVEVKIQEALRMLQGAAKKYERLKKADQVEKVRKFLASLYERVERSPYEYKKQ
ncbi:MAG: hypothetical protein ACFFBD_12240 [Candidatus Hodarchaeota archaeon]